VGKGDRAWESGLGKKGFRKKISGFREEGDGVWGLEVVLRWGWGWGLRFSFTLAADLGTLSRPGEGG